MPAFDSDGIEIPSPREEDVEVVLEIGGQFDDCSFYLEFFHESLDKEEISSALGLAPSQAWNTGEPHPIGNGSSGHTRVDDYGKWALKVPVKTVSISDALQEFLCSCSASTCVWRDLSLRWSGRIALVGRTRSWNREFSLSAEAVAAIADRGLKLNFDAYFCGDNANAEA